MTTRADIDDVEAVRAAATRFRSALEHTQGLVHRQVHGFPRGACGDSAVLLGQYLQDCGFGIWTFNGRSSAHDDSTHAWIERDGLIVDVTADQFDDVDDAVIVTRDRAWHSEFKPLAGGKHDANLAAHTGVDNRLVVDYPRLRRAADAQIQDR